MPYHHLPLVSIITNTWDRKQTLLSRLIPAVEAQTYPRIEHVIVSDGIDTQLREWVRNGYVYQPNRRRKKLPRIQYRIYQLGFRTSIEIPDSFGCAPLQAGCWLARGDYMICIPDDDIMTPTHIADCATYLTDEPSIGFVYTGFKQRVPGYEAIIQSTEPRAGVIASPMFRRSLLSIASWEMHQGLVADWQMVKRWLDADIEYGFIDTPTFEHFADHPISDVLYDASRRATVDV